MASPLIIRKGEGKKTRSTWTSLIKANRFIYNNKSKMVEIATKYRQQDSDAVSQTYDILATAGAWPVNDGLPKDRWNGRLTSRWNWAQSRLRRNQATISLIDLSVIQAALTKAGGRLTGDKRWD